MSKKRTKAKKIKITNLRQTKVVLTPTKNEQSLQSTKINIVEDQIIGYSVRLINRDLFKSLVWTLLLVIILLAIFLYTKNY